MPKLISITCNGPGKYLNKVDIAEAMREQWVVKGKHDEKPKKSSPTAFPDRLVLRCQFCSEGRVIITREMLG